MARSRGRAWRALLLAAASVLVGACLADAPTPVPSLPATPTPDPPPAITHYPLDTTVWYGGFELRVISATATLGARGGPIEVILELINRGPDETTLGGPIRLTAGGQGLDPSRDSVLPLVAPGGTAKATLTFEADGTFAVADAALRIGRSEEHQAIVPLASNAQATVTLEPLAFPLGGEVQAGDLRVTVKSAEIRYDLPDVGLQLPRSSVILILTYDASFRSAFSGGFAFTTANLGLTLPDGETIAARPDGHSAPAIVLAPGVVVVGLQSRFEVPASGLGLYHLVIRDGAASKTLELAVAGI